MKSIGGWHAPFPSSVGSTVTGETRECHPSDTDTYSPDLPLCTVAEKPNTTQRTRLREGKKNHNTECRCQRSTVEPDSETTITTRLVIQKPRKKKSKKKKKNASQEHKSTDIMCGSVSPRGVMNECVSLTQRLRF